MKKVLRYFAFGVVILVVAIQFFRPEHGNPPVDPAKELAHVPADVRASLERSCFDCHSNQTVWPWYSNIAPVSWLVGSDVKAGRRHLNFSEWEGYATGKRAAKLDDIIDELEKENMPPGTYRLIHRDAHLSHEERERVVSWATGLADSLGAGNKHAR